MNITKIMELLENVLVGAIVLIQGEKKEDLIHAEIKEFGEGGYLFFNANGTLRGEFPSIDDGRPIWDPNKEDFPKCDCAVRFPTLVFTATREGGFHETQYSCNWKFQDPENQKLVDGFIVAILSRSGAADFHGVMTAS